MVTSGTVSKRTYPSGEEVWYYQIDLPRKPGEKRQRITESGFKTKRAADEALEKFLGEKQQNRFVAPGRQTVAEYLAEWLTEHADRNLSPKTADRYRELLEKYVMPRIGPVLLKDLDPGQLEKLYANLRDNGSLREGGGQLSPKTVRHIHGTLHAALSKAVRWKRITTNPADLCDLPRMQKREITTPDQAEAQLILDAAFGTPLYMPALIAAFTGMRRGEVLALQWFGVDVENRTVKVSRSLCQVRKKLIYKGTKGNRVRSFPLPQAVISALRTHREQQEKYREMFGPDYKTDLDLIVCEPDGSEIYPDNFTAAFCAMVRKKGGP
jgi:integrase